MAAFDLSAMQLVAQHRRVAVDHCVEALAHSCLCADAYCRLPACPKMKRVVIHTNICQRKNKGNCPVCKQLIALCCYHAKNCKDTRCVVPFCNMVKQKMRRQRVYERLRTARGLPPDEPDEIDVNMVGGVSGWTWRMVRIVPNCKENSADDEGQDVREVNGDDHDQANHEDEGKDQAECKNNDEDQAVREDDDEDPMREVESPTENDSSDSNSPADNNNVGENDVSDTSSDEGANENEQSDTSSSDDNSAAYATAEDKSESTESE